METPIVRGRGKQWQKREGRRKEILSTTIFLKT
jgi:hypothetical protein